MTGDECALDGLLRQTRAIEGGRTRTGTRHRGRSFYGRYDINYDRINISSCAADCFRHRRLILSAGLAWPLATSRSAAAARVAIVVATRSRGELSTLRFCAFCCGVFVVAAAELTRSDLPGEWRSITSSAGLTGRCCQRHLKGRYQKSSITE